MELAVEELYIGVDGTQPLRHVRPGLFFLELIILDCSLISMIYEYKKETVTKVAISSIYRLAQILIHGCRPLFGAEDLFILLCPSVYWSNITYELAERLSFLGALFITSSLHHRCSYFHNI